MMGIMSLWLISSPEGGKLSFLMCGANQEEPAVQTVHEEEEGC